MTVPGLARTGLIFTRIQEGTQPGRLTQPQPGQTEQGIPYHVPSYWVPVGGEHGGNSLAAQEGSATTLASTLSPGCCSAGITGPAAWS